MAGMLYLCALAACILGALTLPPIVPNSDKLCVDGQRIATPCVCCKKDCWFTVATLAAEELGHIPGTGGRRRGRKYIEADP
ncbi:unnamed protein product, partial [Mesorhabditis spiculigera]